MVMCRSARFAVLILGIAQVFLNEAKAYIPPSEFVMKTLLQKRAAVKSWRVRGLVKAVPSSGEGSGARFIEETVYDTSSRKLKSAAFDEMGRLLYSVERILESEEGGPELRTVVSAIIFENRLSRLSSILRSWNIPLKREDELLRLPDEKARINAERMFLDRRKLGSAYQVNWVIGEKSANQLWVEKDTFLPSRLFMAIGDRYDVSFESYQGSEEVPMPRVISLSREGELMIREEVQEVSMNASSGSTAVQIEGSGFTDVGNSVDSTIRDLIRRFYTVLR